MSGGGFKLVKEFSLSSLFYVVGTVFAFGVSHASQEAAIKTVKTKAVDNAKEIKAMKVETSSLDVINHKIDTNAKSLDEIKALIREFEKVK